jgi:hypothetical protein
MVRAPEGSLNFSANQRAAFQSQKPQFLLLLIKTRKAAIIFTQMDVALLTPKGGLVLTAFPA